MKSTAGLCLSVAVASLSPGHAVDVSPIAKILEMISDLQTKIIGEGQTSQKVYEEYSEWCEERSKDLMFEVKGGKTSVADLTAVISEEDATIEALTSEVEEHSSKLASAEKDLKAATEVRDKERADFAEEDAESTKTIGTVTRAIGLLKKGGASMLQFKGAASIANALNALVQASSLGAADAERLTALVQSDSGDDDAGAPAAAGYENQSGGIVELLNGILEKAQTQQEDARKQEEANAHNYEMLKQSLDDEIKFGNRALNKAKKGIAKSSEKKATAEGDLAVTSKDLNSDVATLSGVHHDCMTKASDFEAETNSRGEELGALAQAKKVIVEATGGAFSQVSFVQVARSQLASSATSTNFQVAKFVRHLAQKQHSRSLELLASRMASAIRLAAKDGSDPFGKIKGLIGDMIAKLEQEAEEGANHKAYCDKEIGETKVKHDDKSVEIEKLATSLDEMSAKSAKLKEEVSTLQTELANSARSQADMDRVRHEENEEYVANKAELDKGIAGIKNALQVLRDYYAKADKAHGSSDGAGGGIIDLLEVVESDFEKSLAEMVQAEETAQRDYEMETKQNELDTTTKSQDVKYKSQEATDLDKASGETGADLRSVQTELAAVNEYWTQLKAECIEKAEPYAEKVQRREAEIAGLREALETLGGGAMLLQKSSTRLLRGVQSHISGA